MAEQPRRRRRPITLLLAVAISTALALGVAELLVRAFVPAPRVLGAIGYADAEGNPVKDLREAAARGLVVPVPGKLPRRRFMFAPGQRFYITYTDNDVLKRDWFDDQGRVANDINSAGIRDREELVAKKPAGQRRIVCLGDSFTFGWGIPVEQGWVRLLEGELRKGGQDVRTVNCGAAGTVCVDEYVIGLEQRFFRFEPDAVILTICLNDLLPSSGLGFIVPRHSTGSRVLDLLISPFQPDPLDLDPERDWVGELLALSKREAEASGLAHPTEKPFEAMWSQGVPQKFLRRGKAWCEARGLPFLVVLWPFLQGLGEGRHYPFQKMHDLVAADCAEAGIPFLDVLPALRHTNHEDLWVTPADPHPNPLSQRLALPLIVEFVQEHTGW